MPGGADGCFGSIVSFTRPPVAFSTSFAQPWSTTAVRWCVGPTHDDMVSVVWASAGGAATRQAAARIVSRIAVSLCMLFSLVAESEGGVPAGSVAGEAPQPITGHFDGTVSPARAICCRASASTRSKTSRSSSVVRWPSSSTTRPSMRTVRTLAPVAA